MSFSGKHPIGVTDSTKWPTLPTTGDEADNLLAGRVASLEAGAGTGGAYRKWKAIDESVTSSTTLQNDDDLSFPIGANEVWTARWVLFIDGDTAGDIKVAWNVPAGGTLARTGQVALDTAATTVAGNLRAPSRGAMTDAQAEGAGAAGAGTNVTAVYETIVINGATAGTVQLRWAQNASSGTATKVLAGSYLIADRASPAIPAGGNKGAMQLVRRITVGVDVAAPAAAVTFTGLDLATDCHYILEWSVGNAIASQKSIYVQLNGDTTATNYRNAIHDWAAAAQVLQNNNNPLIGSVAASTYASGVLEIFKPATGGVVKGWTRAHYGTTAVPEILHGGWLWNSTANPTQLVVTTSDASSAFISGSEFRLYRCAPTPVADDGFREVIAVADQDVASNTTVANDNELFFTMEAGKLYEWEAKIVYSSPAGGTTPDFKFNVNGPATLTGQTAFDYYVSTADVFNAGYSQQALTTVGTVGTATTPRLVRFKGWAYSTAGGTGSSGFVFQWAQNTSSANATRRHAGSMLRWRKAT